MDEKGQFRLRVALGLNYPQVMSLDLWQRTESRAELEAGLEVKAGESTTVTFRVAAAKPW